VLTLQLVDVDKLPFIAIQSFVVPEYVAFVLDGNATNKKYTDAGKETIYFNTLQMEKN
jgi:hypothetical protein